VQPCYNPFKLGLITIKGLKESSFRLGKLLKVAELVGVAVIDVVSFVDLYYNLIECLILYTNIY